MSGLPDITVAATMVADPEIRYLANGTAVANFTVAANDRRLNKDTGQWEDAGATFLRCSVWRDMAENVAESLTKGQRVLLTGRLKQREWETDEGEKRYAFEVDVAEVGPSLKWATAKPAKTTRSRGGNTDPWATKPTAPPTGTPAAATAGAANGSGFSDEPPF